MSSSCKETGHRRTHAWQVWALVVQPSPQGPITFTKGHEGAGWCVSLKGRSLTLRVPTPPPQDKVTIKSKTLKPDRRRPLFPSTPCSLSHCEDPEGVSIPRSSQAL